MCDSEQCSNAHRSWSKNRSCDPCGSRFQVYRLNHSATLSRVQTAVDRHGSRTRSLQIFQSVRYRVDGVHLHPVGFEPTPPKRLGLKSNAFLARRDRRKTNSATGSLTAAAPISHAINTKQLRRDSNPQPQIRSLIRHPLRHGVVFVYKGIWRTRGLNPGLSACKADALPLSYTPFP